MIEPKRARRRRDLQRMKAHARRIHPDWKNVHYRADYLVVCSCWMCGNPRRTFKRLDALTVQEHRADLAWLDED